MQAKLGALAGIKKKKAQAGKNRDRFATRLSVCFTLSHFLQARQEACSRFEKEAKGC
jgi:hypothetical protein